MPLMLFPEDQPEDAKRLNQLWMQEMQSNHFEKPNVFSHMREVDGTFFPRKPEDLKFMQDYKNLQEAYKSYSPMWKDGQLMTKNAPTSSYYTGKGPKSYSPMWKNFVEAGSRVSSLSQASNFLAAATVPFQIADQATAAAGWDGNTTLDREYGNSDPLSIRPAVDQYLNTPFYDAGAYVGMPYTREGKAARATYQARVNDPEYIYRNPISSMVGQAARGNMDYVKAFANEYLPQDYQFRYSNSPSNRERVGLYKK